MVASHYGAWSFDLSKMWTSHTEFLACKAFIVNLQAIVWHFPIFVPSIHESYQEHLFLASHLLPRPSERYPLRFIERDREMKPRRKRMRFSVLSLLSLLWTKSRHLSLKGGAKKVPLFCLLWLCPSFLIQMATGIGAKENITRSLSGWVII